MEPTDIVCLSSTSKRVQSQNDRPCDGLLSSFSSGSFCLNLNSGYLSAAMSDPPTTPDASKPIVEASQEHVSGQKQLPMRFSSQVFSRFLVRWIGAAALILFICSSIRHLLFYSTAFDLGIYDQVVYLISQGMPPISSFLGFHHMGNHAAYSVYPLALLYALYPAVYWLLIVQAVCLALGALPTWLLAQQAGLSPSLCRAMVVAYLLYPLVLNVNLFDFHPEVMALPAILAAIWVARAGKVGWFCVAIGFILGCKDALSLTVAAMGAWLFVFEKRRFCGALALIAGVAWFLIATQWIIPTFSGGEVAAVGRYNYLGDSVLEIALNLLLQPGIILGRVFSLETAQYFMVLLFPLAWGLSPYHLAPLVSAIPALVVNILSESGGQRDLVHQYSLPILPFLLVSVMMALSAGRGWLQRARWIMLWSLAAFVITENYYSSNFRYFSALDTWRASREAIAQIPAHAGGVMTDNYYGAHLSQRPQISLAQPRLLKRNLPETDYVLLNLRHPFPSDRDRIETVMQRLEKHPDFQLSYNRDDVYLFTRSIYSKKTE